jgi:hypothetical protein
VRFLERIRPWGLLCATLGALVLVLSLLDQREPIVQWLFWPYAAITGSTLLFGTSCLVMGHAAVAALSRKEPLPLRERLLVDFAVGVLLFAVGVFLVGLAGGLGGVFFWALPLGGLVAGLPAAWRDGRRIIPRVLRQRSRARRRPSLLTTLALGFGVVGLLRVYLSILTPENVSFDGRWYHLGIAEYYLAAGRIRAFPEGWFVGTHPHLASWLYTWAFALPASSLFFRIELCAHVEFLIFVVTLAGLSLLVERLLFGRRVRGAWAGMFLFPGLFLYDSSLGLTADHVLAFWAIPLTLVARRFSRSWDAGHGLVLAALCAGAALTKSQSIYLLAPVAAHVAVGALLALRRRQYAARHLLRVLSAVLGTSLLFTAPHWLANLVWYGNPVYPFLGTVFPSHPWRPGLAGYSFDQGWEPVGTLTHRFFETALAPFTFAFGPHDWWDFHRDVPVFGFLFTLSFLLFPFLPRTRRVAWLALGTMGGVWLWFGTFHQDRYLQALLPWMAAVTVATLVRAWDTGLPLKVGVTAMVTLQLVWGADVPFVPTPAGSTEWPLQASLWLLSSTFRQDTSSRFEPHTGFEEAQAALPPAAVVLFHEDYVRLGLGRPAVTDNPRWQGGLDYGQLANPARIFAELHGYGVTHLLAWSGRCRHGELSLSSELLFHHFLVHFADDHRRVGGLELWSMPERAPAARPLDGMAFLGCGLRARIPLAEADAVYRGDEDAGVADSTRLDPVDEAMLAGTELAAIDERCPVPLPPGFDTRWESVTQWNRLGLWVRRPARDR